MAVAPSTLRTLKIGGQIDPAWALDTGEDLVWSDVRVIATLGHATEPEPYVDPTNGAHEHPLAVSRDLTAAVSAGQWATAALKPTISADPDDALQPTGLAWTITVHVLRSKEWVCVATYTVTLDGTVDYEGTGKTITVADEQVVNINDLLPPPTTDPVSNAFTTGVLEVLAANPPDGSELTLPAAEALSALRVVTLAASGAALFEPVISNAGRVLGVTKTSANLGEDVIVATSGPVDVTAAGLTAGAPYYVAAGGTLTVTQPTSGLLVPIGFAADSDTFVVNVGDPIELA